MKKSNQDILLSALAESDGLGITVFVKGAVITGTITKESQYMRQVITGVDGTTASLDALAEAAEAAEALRDAVAEKEDEDLTDDDYKLLRKSQTHLNLTQARFLTSSGFQPKVDGTNIRLRLDAVDAWIFGQSQHS